MTEVFINIEELNDEDLAITITDEDGIFINELGDDLLSVSLQELENKLNDLGYMLTYDEEDINYYIDKFKSIFANRNIPTYSGMYITIDILQNKKTNQFARRKQGILDFCSP